LLCYHDFISGGYGKNLKYLAQVITCTPYKPKYLQRRSIELRRSCWYFKWKW